MKIDIVSYEDQYLEDFKNLSYEWLEKYVSVEPEDERILNNPREVILNRGGHIYFAQDGNKLVGTVALIRLDSKLFELAKLAVTEDYKGQGIGDLLMEVAIDKAGQLGAEKVLLFTARKLVAAIGLYVKHGFKEIPLEENKYIESDVLMELIL